jgi:hypothetical protein
MQHASRNTGKGANRTALIVGGLGVLFLIFDASLKVFGVGAAVQGTESLGYPVSLVAPIGWIEVALLVVYLVPRTAPLGAILWTGYLGGAMATHVRLLNPLFSHILFPVYIAALLWTALYLRDRRVRALLAPRDG